LRESRRALYQGTTLLALKNTQKTLGFRVCVRTRNAGISAEKFARGQGRQGLKALGEKSVLEGHGFSRAVNNIAIPGFHGKPGQVSR
jgi:hypothetical protein